MVKGDVRDAAALDAAVAGQEAVMVAVGPRSLSETDLQQTMYPSRRLPSRPMGAACAYFLKAHPSRPRIPAKRPVRRRDP